MADDYSFMKSGFDNLVHEDPTENIASIVLVFMENAVNGWYPCASLELFSL